HLVLGAGKTHAFGRARRKALLRKVRDALAQLGVGELDVPGRSRRLLGSPQGNGAGGLATVVREQTERIGPRDIRLSGQQLSRLLFGQEVVEEPLHRPRRRAVYDGSGRARQVRRKIEALVHPRRVVLERPKIVLLAQAPSGLAIDRSHELARSGVHRLSFGREVIDGSRQYRLNCARSMPVGNSRRSFTPSSLSTSITLPSWAVGLPSSRSPMKLCEKRPTSSWRSDCALRAARTTAPSCLASRMGMSLTNGLDSKIAERLF